MIIEGWLNKDLHSFLEKEFLYSTPHYYGHKSGAEGKNVFYNTTLNQEDPMIRFLSYKLQKTLNNKLIFHRTYINIQHPKMNGDFHQDEGNFTCLYMVTGNGNFEIQNEKVIEFKKDKLICFDSKKFHKGLAPDEGVRITLTFKTTNTGEKYNV
tara:strand:+ start:1374 stop:1835 length:462 start_codon:yes stop_codon:yes gene_type:complete